MSRAVRILANVAGVFRPVSGIRQVDEVEHVRRLEPELKHRAADQADVAEHAEVDVLHARAFDDAAAARCRRVPTAGSANAARVEPLLDQLPRAAGRSRASDRR